MSRRSAVGVCVTVDLTLLSSAAETGCVARRCADMNMQRARVLTNAVEVVTQPDQPHCENKKKTTSRKSGVQ